MRGYFSRIYPCTALGILVFAITGCGTLINSKQSDAVFKNLPVNGRLTVDGVRYKYEARYAAVSLDNKDDHFITVTADNFEPYVFAMRRTELQWPYFLDIVLIPALSGVALKIFVADWTNILLIPAIGAGVAGVCVDKLSGKCYGFKPATFRIPALKKLTTIPPSAIEPGGKPAKRLTIAIIDMKPVGVPRTDAEMVSEIIRGKFVQGGTFIVVDRKDIDKILKEQAFQLTGCVSAECAVKVGRLLGVQVVCTGTYGKLGDNLQLILKLVDVETGEILFAGRAKGKTVDALEMDGEALRAQIRTRFHPDGSRTVIEPEPADVPGATNPNNQSP